MRRNDPLALLTVSIILVASFSFVLTYIHDNPIGLTQISSINSGATPIGSNVTIKGQITHIMVLWMFPNDQLISLTDGTGNLTFDWTRSTLDVGWNIIVQGTVHHNTRLYPVSNVELVLLFS